MMTPADITLTEGSLEGVATAVGAIFTFGGSLLALIVKRRAEQGDSLTKDDVDKAVVSNALDVARNASPEAKSGLDSMLLGQAMGFAQEFNERANAAEMEARAANERIARLEKSFDDMQSQFRHMELTIQTHVGPIVAWIDNGAPPPAPDVADDLRKLLVRIEG